MEEVRTKHWPCGSQPWAVGDLTSFDKENVEHATGRRVMAVSPIFIVARLGIDLHSGLYHFSYVEDTLLGFWACFRMSTLAGVACHNTDSCPRWPHKGEHKPPDDSPHHASNSKRGWRL